MHQLKGVSMESTKAIKAKKEDTSTIRDWSTEILLIIIENKETTSTIERKPEMLALTEKLPTTKKALVTKDITTLIPRELKVINTETIKGNTFKEENIIEVNINTIIKFQ